MALADMFDRGMSLGPQNIAYIKGDDTWTFQRAHDFTCRVARALIADGFEKGAKAAVLAANDPKAWLCVLSVWRAGLAWLPLNPRSPVPDHIQLLSAFDAEVLFYQKAFEPTIKAIREACPNVRAFICLDGEVAGDKSLDAWSAAFPATPPERLVNQDDLAGIMPTGGTTGIPKGVMVNHRSLCLSLGVSVMNTPYPPGAPIVNLAAAPMTHTAGFLSLAATVRNGTIVVMEKPDPVAILDLITSARITEFFLPPTVIYRLLDVPDLKQRDLSSIRYFMYGAAPMSVEKLRLALQVFGEKMFQGYGQTESPGSIAFMRPGDHFRNGEIADDYRLSAAGLPSIMNATAILNDEGKPLPAGETGEICVRGDIVMMGYYKQPEKTAEAIVDGWLHTGDLGHIDTEGFVHITDRKRDMIITGGFNVFPSEVEQVVWSHPAVLDCAVIGVPDPDWGEAVKAVVELKPGASATAAELIALCKEKLGSVKAPKSIDFIDTLPRSPVGKVLKKDIREPYWKDVKRRI